MSQAMCVFGMILMCVGVLISTAMYGGFNGISLLFAVLAAGFIAFDLYLESRGDRG